MMEAHGSLTGGQLRSIQWTYGKATRPCKMLRRPLAHALAAPASCISSAQLGATPTDDLAKRRGVGMNLYKRCPCSQSKFSRDEIGSFERLLCPNNNYPIFIANFKHIIEILRKTGEATPQPLSSGFSTAPQNLGCANANLSHCQGTRPGASSLIW